MGAEFGVAKIVSAKTRREKNQLGDVVEFIDELAIAFETRWKKAEDELARARAQIKDLQSLVETDPLLNILNRRGELSAEVGDGMKG